MRRPCFVSCLLSGFVGMMASSPAFAVCNPVISDDLALRVVCATHADKTCSQLGNSTMDGDKQNIIVCLATAAGSDCAAGQCQWKAMTSSGSSSAADPPFMLAVSRGADGDTGDTSFHDPNCAAGYTRISTVLVSSYDNWTKVALCQKD